MVYFRSLFDELPDSPKQKRKESPMNELRHSDEV